MAGPGYDPIWYLGLVLGICASTWAYRRRGGPIWVRPAMLIVAAAVVIAGVEGLRVDNDPGVDIGLAAAVGALGAFLFVIALFDLPRRDPGSTVGLGARWIAWTALAVAGWIHLVLVPEHLGVSFLLGVGFLVSAIAEFVLAGLVLVRVPGPRIWYAVIGITAALLAVYVVAVLIGLPFVPMEANAEGIHVGSGEPIDLPGAVSKVAEAIALAVSVAALMGSPWGPTDGGKVAAASGQN